MGCPTFNPLIKRYGNQTFSVLFYVKKTKPLRNGDVPVFARVTVNGDRAEFSLERGIPLELWDSKKNRARGHGKVARELNEFLSSVSAQLYNHQKDYLIEGEISQIPPGHHFFPQAPQNQFLLLK